MGEEAAIVSWVAVHAIGDRYEIRRRVFGQVGCFEWVGFSECLNAFFKLSGVRKDKIGTAARHERVA